MPIVWREQMSVGIKSIDEDHQRLIMLVNQFADVIRQGGGLSGGNEGAIRTLLGRLQAYTNEHFAREERIQDQANYPGLKENRSHHAALITELNRKIERYAAGEKAEKKLTGEELSAFLNSWLVNHIIKVDLKMKSHKFTGVW